MLPNLVIIGAMKSGTTSLHNYLSRHPEIAMSKQKELHFFSAERNWKQGVKWYEAHFIVNAKIRGESSASYAKYPKAARVPQRMHSLIPDAKLIYILRDPVDRIISEYRHYRADGSERRLPTEALRDLKDNQYVYNSKYFTQLKQFLEYYSEDNIFITTTEELNKQPQQTIQKVFTFLNVDDSFYHPDFTKRLHVSDEKRLKNTVGLFLTKKFRNSEIKNKIRSALPSFINQAYVSMTRSNSVVEKVTLDDTLKQRLIDELQGDIHQLRHYTGNRFADWCV